MSAARWPAPKNGLIRGPERVEFQKGLHQIKGKEKWLHEELKKEKVIDSHCSCRLKKVVKAGHCRLRRK